MQQTNPHTKSKKNASKRNSNNGDSVSSEYCQVDTYLRYH